MTDQPAHECVENMNFHLNLQSFGDTNIKYLEVRGGCSICGRRMRFRGQAGLSPSAPTTAIDGSEAIFPFLFEGETYDGKGSGYTVSVVGAN